MACNAETEMISLSLNFENTFVYSDKGVFRTVFCKFENEYYYWGTGRGFTKSFFFV